MATYIEITDPKGVEIRNRTIPKGKVIEYPFYASVALISSGRAKWADNPEGLPEDERTTAMTPTVAERVESASSNEPDENHPEDEEVSDDVSSPVSTGGSDGVDTQEVRLLLVEQDHHDMGEWISEHFPGETPGRKAARVEFLEGILESIEEG